MKTLSTYVRIKVVPFLSLTAIFLLLANNVYAQSQITVNASATNYTGCNTNDGMVSATPGGGDGNGSGYDIYISGSNTGYNSEQYISNGGTANFNSLLADNYTVIVYDEDDDPNTGGSGTYGNSQSGLTVSNGNCGSPISASVSGTGNANTNCSGDASGSITISASGGDGTNNYSFSLYNTNDGSSYSGSGGSGTTIYSVTQGNYSITVSDAANPNDGYSTTTGTSVGYNSNCGSPISASVSGTGNANTNCSGDASGSITISASGGDGANNYSFSLYNTNDGSSYSGSGGSGTTIYSVTQGNYNITVSDAANSNDGYATTTSTSVGYNSNCGSSISEYICSSTNASCPSSSDGSVTICMSGGDGNNNFYAEIYNGSNGQTYSAGPSNGNTSITISGIPYGYYYYIYVYDANNPGDGWATYDYIYTYPISYNSSTCPGPISASVTSSTNETCPGSDDGSITVTISSGGDGTNNFYGFLYDNYGQYYYAGPTNGGTTLTFTELPADAYYYYAYIYDNNNPNDGYATYVYINSYYIGDNSNYCPGPISASIYSTSNASTPCSTDGSITVYATGGDGTNNYNIQAYNADNGQWYYAGPSNGSNYITVNVPYGYYYYVYVYDASNESDGYADYLSPYVSISYNSGTCPGPISYTIQSYTQPSCPSSYDGSITFSISGGDGTDNYNISLYNADFGTWYYGSGGNNATVSGIPYGYYYYILVQDADNPGDQWADNNYGAYFYLNYNSSNCPGPISASISSSTQETCPGQDNGSLTVTINSGGDGTNNFYGYLYDNYGQYYYAGPTNGGTTLTFTGLPAAPEYYYAYIYDYNNSGDGYATYVDIYSYYITDQNGSCGSSISEYICGSSNASCPSSSDGSVTICMSGGDGNNNFVAEIYNSDGQTFSSGQSNGSTSLTITGIPYGYYYYIYVYDADNPGDGWASYDYIYTYPISYNNGSCGSTISAYICGTSNASCPSSDDGSITVCMSGGDGTNNFIAQAYNSSTGQTFTSGASGGSTSVTITGVSYGYYYYIYVYDASNPGDGWAYYDYIYDYPISYNSGSCGSPISAYICGTSNASCPSSDDGSITVCMSGGDGTNNFIAQAYNSSTGQTFTSGASGGSTSVTITGVSYGYYYYIYVYDASNPGDGWAYYDYIYDYPVSYNSGSCGSPISEYICGTSNASCPTSSDGSITICMSGGDGTDNFIAQAYNSSTGQTFTSGSSGGSTSVTITGISYGYYYYIYVYDASNSGDGWASYDYIYDYPISYNSASCSSSCAPFPIPSNAVVYSADASPGCIPGGVAWVCAGVTINTLTGCGSQTFYLEPGATVNNGGGGSNTIYERAGAIYTGYGGGENIIYSDPTASYSNPSPGFPGGTTFCDGLTFDYSNAPAGGCANISPITIGSPSVINETCSLSNGSISISATGGKGTWAWSISPNVGSITGQGTSNVTFSGLSANGGPYTISVTDNVGDNASTASISLTNTVPASGTISGPTTVCSNSAPYRYIVAAGESNYQWSLPGGSNQDTIASGQGTYIVTVTWATNNTTGTGTGYIEVSFTDIHGCHVNSGPLSIVINEVPNANPNIDGSPDTVCPNSSETFNTSPGYSNYNWQIAGGTITGGGTSSVTVAWDSVGPAFIQVIFANSTTGCEAVQGQQDISFYTVTSGSITGPSGAVCSNSTPYNYKTLSGGTNYLWSFPNGSANAGNIISGQGTDSVSVAWATADTTGTGTGYLKVSFIDAHGCSINSGPHSFPINEVPIANPNLSAAPVSVCPNSSETFNTSPGYSNYNWQVIGGTITGGGTSADDSATIAWGAVEPASVQVDYSNSTTGCVAVQGQQDISIYPSPSDFITANGDTLSSSTGFSSYQWFLNDTIISGAIHETYIANQLGNYSVQVVDSNGCMASANFADTITGIIKVDGSEELNIYPDPFVNTLFIAVNNPTPGIESIEIYDALGRMILSKNTGNSTGNLYTLDVSQLAAGPYYVAIKRTGIKTYYRQMIKLTKN